MISQKTDDWLPLAFERIDPDTFKFDYESKKDLATLTLVCEGGGQFEDHKIQLHFTGVCYVQRLHLRYSRHGDLSFRTEWPAGSPLLIPEQEEG